jgi:hypothetical protein
MIPICEDGKHIFVDRRCTTCGISYGNHIELQHPERTAPPKLHPTALAEIRRCLQKFDMSYDYCYEDLKGSTREQIDDIASLISRREREAKIEALEWVTHQGETCDLYKVVRAEIARLKENGNG